MSSLLAPCPECSRHVKVDEKTCPFCSEALPANMAGRAQQRPVNPARFGRAALVSFGAALAASTTACASDDETGTGTDGQNVGGSSGEGADAAASGGSGGSSQGGSAQGGSAGLGVGGAVQPVYGAPIDPNIGQPEYGVPVDFDAGDPNATNPADGGAPTNVGDGGPSIQPVYGIPIDPP